MRIGLWRTLLFLCLAFVAEIAWAQDPIRVQTDEVLVPTVVYDKELYAKLNKMKPHHRDTAGHIMEKNEKLWDQIVVKNLTAKDFHLFEDGREQRIQRVKLEPPGFRVVHDNLGKHPETIGTGGGIWAYPDRPATDQSTWLALPQYVIAYAPPRSVPGSCHQIQVKVQSAKLTVWTRSEYCNTTHPASDPLNGTELGKKMEAAAGSGTAGAIDVKARVAAFADNPGDARVYVTMSFPWQSLAHEIHGGTLYASIGSLVMVYRKDGTLTARYSDFACCDYGSEGVPKKDAETATAHAEEASALIPNRYQTQFALPAGKYEIRVVLSDGEKFGVQRLELRVEAYDPGRLGISDVVLSRRVHKASTDATGADEQVSGSYAPLLSKGVEITPTADPQFWPEDTLYAYFEINDPLVAGRPSAKVQADMRIVEVNSGAEADTFAPVDVAKYSMAGSPVIAVARGMFLNKLSPGAYRMEVRASDAEGQSTTWKSAEFVVMEAAPLKVGGPTAEKREEVILNVTALDASGHAVTDLTSADWQIFEDDPPQAITSIRVTSPEEERDSPAPPIVILFDLLNTAPLQREYIARRMIKALEPLEKDEGIYLYLLTNEGKLYPVRPKGTMQVAAIAQGSVGGGNSETVDDAPPWTKEIRPLLDHAIDEVHGFRLMDYKDVAMQAVITFSRLGQIAGEMANVRGPKTILWVTSGVPNFIGYPYGGCVDQTFYGVSNSYLAGKCTWDCHPNPSDTKCLDYTPFLRHLGAEAAATDTIVSSLVVNAGGLLDFARGTPANTLRQLADITGGQVYLDRNGDVEKAIHEALLATGGRYQLTYAAEARDGKYHKVRVVCTRPGVRVVPSQGYFAGGAEE